MLRICRTCSVEYEGAPGSTLCPACVKAQKSTTIRTRIWYEEIACGNYSKLLDDKGGPENDR